MGIEFTNNATSLLALPVSHTDGTATIEAGDVGLFPVPNPGTGDYFYATLEDRRVVPTRREIVKVTNRTGATFTITRAQDHTVAADFFVGSIFSHRLNAAALRDWMLEETNARIAADIAEANVRASYDAYLLSLITAETNARIAGDAALQAQINAEISRATAAEANLQAQISGLAGSFAAKDALNAEIARAEAAEAALGARIDAETAARIAADQHLQDELDAEIARAKAAEAAISGSVPTPPVSPYTQHKGSVTTDAFGGFTIDWTPPYTKFFGGVLIDPNDPFNATIYPGSSFVANLVTFSHYDGQLWYTDNLQPPNQNYGSFVTFHYTVLGI